MFKEYLYLTRRERAACLILTVLTIAAQLALWTSGKWIPAFTKAIGLQRRLNDSTFIQQTPFTTVEAENYTYNHQNRLPPPVVYHPFNPNTADSATFISLGIKPYVARNIIKYRNKGGQFKKPEDFSKIYGLDKSVFESLLPYIQMDSAKKPKGRADVMSDKTDTLTSPIIKQAECEPFEQSETTPVIPIAGFELNTADTALLQLLKGVGPATAGRIVRYGNQLGGYYNVSQLAEIKGLNPNVLAGLQKSLTVNPSLIRKININKASLERLRIHPYLDFYQAKTIIDLRKARKGIKDLSELSEFNEFTTSDLERLKWYLEL